jgi:hypothetical protein
MTMARSLALDSPRMSTSDKGRFPPRNCSKKSLRNFQKVALQTLGVTAGSKKLSPISRPLYRGARKRARNMQENIMIELNEYGLVAVHADIADTPFVNLISPAIVQLDEAIQKLQSFVSSEAFQRAVVDTAVKLGTIAAERDAESSAA